MRKTSTQRAGHHRISRLRDVGTVDVTQIRRRVCTDDSILRAGSQWKRFPRKVPVTSVHVKVNVDHRAVLWCPRLQVRNSGG